MSQSPFVDLPRTAGHRLLFLSFRSMWEGTPMRPINIWGRLSCAFLAPGRSPRSFAASLCVCCIVHRIHRPSSSTHGSSISQKNSTVVAIMGVWCIFQGDRKKDHSAAHTRVHRSANTTAPNSNNNNNIHSHESWPHVAVVAEFPVMRDKSPVGCHREGRTNLDHRGRSLRWQSSEL